MKLAATSAAILLALSTAALAQGGGYPASPSHGVTGTNPDGSPRYGGEPGKSPGNTVGSSSGSSASSESQSKGAAEAAPRTGNHRTARQK